MNSLKLVENKVSKGGVVIVHDYNNTALPGVAKAVDEWVKCKHLRMAKFMSAAVFWFGGPDE